MFGEDEPVRRAQENDSAAFDRLVRRHMRRAHTTCLAVVKNQLAAADDAPQKTFITAQRKRAGSRGGSSLKT